MITLSSLLILSASVEAEAGSCRKVSVGQLTKQSPPGVLVLGERPGVVRDVRRTKRIVKKLARSAPVTLGVEFVEAKRQPVLDKLALGRVSFDALDNVLAFQDDGYTFSVYGRLLALPEKVDGLSLVGLGMPMRVRPEEVSVAMPPGYAMVITDAMGASPVPPELENRTAQMVAYHDTRIARTALEAWTGEGWLVLLVDRTWVQGGLGIPWQLERMTDVEVDAVLLSDAKSDCYPEDLVLR